MLIKGLYGMNKNETMFKGLSKAGLEVLSQKAETVNLNEGDVVIRENDVDEGLFMVVDGTLHAQKKVPPKKMKTIKSFNPGDMFGISSFISAKPSRYTISAETPAALYRVDRKILQKLPAELERYFLRKMTVLARDRLENVERRESKLTIFNMALMEEMFLQATQNAPGIESSEFIREVISKIPRLPVFALSLAGKLLEDDITSREVADEVKKDPSLAGMILKTINSSYHGMAHEVSDLHDAIVLLGFNAVSQITIAEGMRRSLPDSPLFREIHDHSQALSYISFEIARELKLTRPSEISTISILHDLGQIIVQLLKMKNPGVRTLFDLIDSSQMGGMLLKSWDLPEIICQTVTYQSYPWFAEPQRVPEKIRTQVGILFLSHLCYDYFQGKPHEELPKSFYHMYLKILGITSLPISEFTHTYVLPGLSKKMKLLPDAFVDLLRDFSKRRAS